MNENTLYPFKFRPIYMERIWGGDMMGSELGRDLPASSVPIGESWELVDREGTESVVDGGCFDGKTLHELIELFGTSLLGKKAAHRKRFPLMVKIIDAGQRLSLQVHPDERSAADIGGGAEAKTEMWYIINSRSNAKIFAGLTSEATKVQLMDYLDMPQVESLMRVYPSSPGDAYFISAGTLHAIGAGNLILEIQQNSDTTYRVNDWGRVDASGVPRELHKEKGLRSIDFTNRSTARIPRSVVELDFNRKLDLIKLCPHFNVSELRLRSVWRDDTVPGETFHLISVINSAVRVGKGDLTTDVRPGETVLVPAAFGEYFITPDKDGETTVIKTTL